MKMSEIRSDFFNTYLPDNLTTNEKAINECEIISRSKLQYISFLSALFNMGDITEKQFYNEANKLLFFVCDVLNNDGTFKNYLNSYTVERLVKYFNNLHNYKMSDPIPLEAF